MQRSFPVTCTRSGKVFGRVLHVESKHKTSASFCYLSNIDIFQLVTHYSTCTRQNMLNFIVPLTYNNIAEEYICIKVTFKINVYIYPGWISRSRLLTTNLKVVSSSTIVAKTFLFRFFFCFQCAPRRPTEPIHMTSSMTFIRDSNSIEGIIIWRNIATTLVPSTR